MQRFGIRMRLGLVTAVCLAALGGLSAQPAMAHHNADDHSADMRLVANSPRPATTNSDEAFWGNYVFAGNYNAFRIIDVSNPGTPHVVVDFLCPASQNDISVWDKLLFLSVGGSRDKETCDSSPATPGTSPFNGIRIFDISDPAHPRFIKGVLTDCGSHTHTLLPDLAHNRVLIYVSSYLLGVPTTRCNVHGKISIIEVPLAAPQTARVISTPSVQPADGCHDITVFMQLKRASAACITDGQIWDISDPVNPRIINHIANPVLNIWHSSAWSWDGKVVAFGDEFGGAAFTPQCAPGDAPLGAIWFYDASNPLVPLGHWSLPQPQSPAAECTAHNFNVIPVKGRYILNTAYYEGGTSIVDFTNPASPRQIAHYNVRTGTQADTWSSYFYNGYVYANDITRGLDVFHWDDAVSDQALKFDHLNPQTQEVLPAGVSLASLSPPPPAAAPASTISRPPLPKTAADAWSRLIGVPLLVAVVAALSTIPNWRRKAG